jgi:hypothetical protein
MFGEVLTLLHGSWVIGHSLSPALLSTRIIKNFPGVPNVADALSLLIGDV